MAEDEKIIELFFERSEQAIHELDRKYGKVCHRLSYNIVNSRQDAEECVNDAYLGAWNAIPPAKPKPLQAYICKIVRNISLKMYYRNKAAKRNSTYEIAMQELEDCLSAPNTVEADSEAIPRDVLYAQGSGQIEGTTESTQVTEVEQTKWGITLSVENVTPVGLTLVCIQSGGIQTGQLQTGSFYKLLVWHDETWQEVPCLIGEVAWKEVAYSIPLDDRVAWEIEWESLYGELPAGTYRIVKPISDFRGPGDYDTEECWVEFEIK